MTAEQVLALCVAVFVIAFLWGEADGARRERDKTNRTLRRRVNHHTTRKDW